MDIKKVSVNMAALDSALSSLERIMDFSAQTGRLRNALTKNDLDAAAALCILAIKEVTSNLTSEAKLDKGG